MHRFAHRILLFGAGAAFSLLLAVPPAIGVIASVPQDTPGTSGLSKDPRLVAPLAALEKKEYKKAVRLFSEAGPDNAGAQFALGYIMANGLGYQKSRYAAETYYRRAAGLGHGPAVYNLALLLLETPDGQLEGTTLLRRAADQGSGRAALALGKLLSQGRGTIYNPEKAEEMFRNAMKVTDTEAEAAYSLALFYLSQKERKPEEALALLNQSAERGFPTAIADLAKIYLRGGGDLPKDVKKAISLLQAGADRGVAEAQFLLGTEFQEGSSVPKDEKKAFEYYQQAANGGHAAASNQVGYCLENGVGVGKNIAQAVKWYQKSAELGLPTAVFNLGVCYEEGRGVEQSAPLACKHYYAAALMGYPAAQNRLAIRYKDGQGVMRDWVAARSWFSLAAKSGMEAAALNLAVMLENGEGGPPDPATAREIYRQSAATGTPMAQYSLGRMFESGLVGERNPVKAAALYKLASEKLPEAKESLEQILPLLTPDDRQRVDSIAASPAPLFLGPKQPGTGQSPPSEKAPASAAEKPASGTQP